MFLISKLVAAIVSAVTKDNQAIISQSIQGQMGRWDDLLLLQGKMFAQINASRLPLKSLCDAEFKVFSQFGEDGILQYLILETNISQKETLFVEFGVQNYIESNTRFLLMKDNWRGLIIDGSREYIDWVRNQDIFWRHDLTAVNAWIDRDNINKLIDSAGFAGDIGILSIDIDGNDYWVWERIEVINPVIVVIEWNSVFGSEHYVSVPYDSKFSRSNAHFSNLFWGASICAFSYLAKRKGYALVGSNAAGNNLFFVRQDRLGRLKELSAEEAYVESRFRDSRDVNGKLNFLGGEARKREILDLPLINVVSGGVTTLRSLNAAG